MQPNRITAASGVRAVGFKECIWSGAKQALDALGGKSISQRLQRRFDLLLVLSSGLLDTKWYLQRYDDVRQAGADPALHFLLVGGAEGRSPSPLFDSQWYLRQYPDVQESGLNPLVHYLRYGAAAGRNPNRYFDSAWYLRRNPDVCQCGINPLSHYLRHGAAEGREPSRYFNSSWHASRNALAAGVNPLAHYLQFALSGSVPSDVDYRQWVEEYDTLTDADRHTISDLLHEFPSQPLISVVMPVFDTDPLWLERAIESVRNQLYPHWQLCISDDASTMPEVRQILERYAGLDRRIVVTYRQENGHISANSNSALALATGEFIALMDCDDELPEQALFWVAEEICRHPDVDLIYSDEDKIDETGQRFQAYFKPDWNEALLLSQNVFSHLGVFRKTLVDKVGGFRSGFEGSQDHDLVLRCCEHTQTSRIRHIPRVLYHWRAIAGSTASAEGVKAKPYAWRAGQVAIEEHLQRSGVHGVVQRVMEQFYQVEYSVPRPAPPVTVIMSWRSELHLLKAALQNLLSSTAYSELQILVAVGEELSSAARQDSWFQSSDIEDRAQLFSAGIESAVSPGIYNRLAQLARGSILCFLDASVKPDQTDWLEKLAARANLSGVGAVAPLIYDSCDDSVDPASTILPGVNGATATRLPKSDGGYCGRGALEQDVSCVPSQCMMVRRDAFEQVGRFAEQFTTPQFADLCLRLRRAGRRIIWTPAVQVGHARGSDGQDDVSSLHDLHLLRQLWGAALDSDCFYSQNLSLSIAYAELAFPPRLPKLPVPGGSGGNASLAVASSIQGAQRLLS